jgi:predicted ribosomally synthesized peptide with SipW-like signal peptide
MLRIVKSLLVIVAVAAIATVSTRAYFSSEAEVDDNVFSTGTLEIRVNGQPEIAGFNFGPAAPGEGISGQFDVNNYGAPWFAGPSNLPANELVISVEDPNDEPGFSDELYNALYVKIEANRGWPTRMPVYEGPLSLLNEKDLLTPRWTDLIPGSSETVYYSVWLPDTGGDQSALMGLSAQFDFLVQGFNPHR